MANDGAERTEAATPRRREKEREKGNFAKSKDLQTALVITAGIALLSAFSGNMFEKIQYIMQYCFTHLNPAEIETQDIYTILGPYAKVTGNVLFPFMISLFILSIFIIRMQVGNILAFSKLKPDLNNISPKKWIDGLKKLFNPFEPNKIMELTKSLLKVVIVGVCGYSVVHGRIDELYGLLGADTQTVFQVIGSILTQMFINMCLAMIVIGMLDMKFQSYQFEKSIKMTKQQIKDEHKDIEGDPKIKGKIRAIQMQMAQQRMMAEIPTADVVVTNPTHYAVAIKYDKLKAPAPIVVAKGIDFVAFKIREVAQNNNVPIVENRFIARTLYNLVELNGIIPSDMFVAVAEILAFVYNKRR